MKSAKEFFERIGSDEAFAKEVDAALRAKREAGATSVFETMIPVAAEYGYEVTEEQLNKINEKLAENVSDEELGKIAGGTSCMPVVVPLVTVLGSLVEIIISVTEA